jgi:hypothetical protein
MGARPSIRGWAGPLTSTPGKPSSPGITGHHRNGSSPSEDPAAAHLPRSAGLFVPHRDQRVGGAEASASRWTRRMNSHRSAEAFTGGPGAGVRGVPKPVPEPVPAGVGTGNGAVAGQQLFRLIAGEWAGALGGVAPGAGSHEVAHTVEVRTRPWWQVGVILQEHPREPSPPLPRWAQTGPALLRGEEGASLLWPAPAEARSRGPGMPLAPDNAVEAVISGSCPSGKERWLCSPEGPERPADRGGICPRAESISPGGRPGGGRTSGQRLQE